MRPWLTLVSAGFALASASGSAMAGGEWRSEPPRTCGYGPFQGAYVGIGTGYASQSTTVTNQRTGASASNDDGGWLIGGFAGYNLQCGRIVGGVETDAYYVDAQASATAAGQTFTSSNNFLGSTRLRAGVAAGSVLFYGTVGVGYGTVEHRFTSPALGFSAKDTETAVGLVAGGGIEMAFSPAIAVRLEGLWSDLGNAKHTYTSSGGGCGGVCTSTQNWEDDSVTVRLGVAYRFGVAPPPPEPVYLPPLK